MLISQKLKVLNWVHNTIFLNLAFVSLFFQPSLAQHAPSPVEIRNYNELFSAAASGDLNALITQLELGVYLEQKDGNERTALLIATHFSHDEFVHVLLENRADSNAMDNQDYDLITIAAVNNDIDVIKLGLDYGADPTAITSPYQGTALIAAAHLGHVETVDLLIKAGAPLDHINNLGWTALIESIVLGDGGSNHTEILRLLVDAGADVTIGNRAGVTPLNLAKQFGFDEMVAILEQADIDE